MNTDSSLKLKTLEQIFLERESGAEDGFRFFSVLVPVVERAGRLFLLYERRARHMARQPGEICFPGGAMEAGETAIECALRETWEEIGIPSSQIRVINQLDTIYTYSNFLMYCHLGVVEETAIRELRLNPDEVAEVFLVSLDTLIREKPEVYRTQVVPKIPDEFPYDKVTGGRPYHWRTGSALVPVYDVDGRVIWGLTARITKRFTDIIRGEICSE